MPPEKQARPRRSRPSQIDRLVKEADLKLKEAEVRLINRQLRTELIKPWLHAFILLTVVTSAGALLYQAREFALRTRGQVFEEYRSAVEKLAADTPQGRAPGYFSLISLLSSSPEDLGKPSLLALLQGLALENDRTLRTGVTHALDDLTIARLNTSSRVEAVEFSAGLIGELSREGAVAEERRLSLVRILGRLISGGAFSQMDFSYMSLDGLEVSDCTLSNSTFKLTSLHKANIENCDLSGSEFIYGSIGASFLNSNLDYVQFKPNLFRPSSFQGSSLRNARLENYSLAEYYYKEPPGWVGTGTFSEGQLGGLKLSRPSVLLIFSGEREAEGTYGFLESALRHRDPEGWTMGLTYGIRPPSTNYEAFRDFLPALLVPLESVLFLSHEDPGFRDVLPSLRDLIKQQFSEDPGRLFEEDWIASWVSTGEVPRDRS